MASGGTANIAQVKQDVIGNIDGLDVKRQRLLLRQRRQMLVRVGAAEILRYLSLCEHPSGRDGIDANSLASKFACQPGRESQDAGLGGRVDRAADNAQSVIDRGDVDDRPAPPTAQ